MVRRAMARSAEADPIGIVVFARLDSHRLPGKALRELVHRPLLARVLDRLRATQQGLPVVLATSDRALDDPIAVLGAGEGVAVFRGSAHDVAGRALGCAQSFGLGAIVRISGDSPFIDPGLIDLCVARFRETPGLDLVTNVMPRTFPVGASVEVISASALARIIAATDDPQDREHVTRYVYGHPDAFRIENVAAPDRRYEGFTLGVDTDDDLVRAAFIVEALGPRVASAPLADVVALARRWQGR